MELHTVVDGLPSGVIGEMFPVVVIKIGEGMVPNGAAVIAVGETIVVDAVMAVAPGIYVETMPGTVDGTGTGTGVIGGDGRGGNAGGGGTGMIEPGKTVAADVSGCWENVNGGITIGGSTDVVGAAETEGVVPMVVPVADVEGAMEITVTVGVPGVI